MQIVEVKNNLVRISYDTSSENLLLSGFILIKDSAHAFIGQIIHLDANSHGNFAIVKLLFNFNDEGVISAYNGSIPEVNALLDTIQSEELLGLFPIKTPVVLGELAQQDTFLKLDASLFEEKLLICSEREEDNQLFIKTIAPQLVNNGKKLLLIDNNGELAKYLDLPENNVVAGQDFKLPLNYDTINFIYEKGLDDAKAETKATIQEIFLEVQNYIKTLPEPYIPFETFKSVVDEQYEELQLVELVLLKNKLLKYSEEGIFAQEKEEFDIFKTMLQSNDITILDLSQIDSHVQREFISYAYFVLNQCNEEFYVINNLDNSNSDKKLLKQILTSPKAYSSIITPYTYKYLKELKQLSKNLILFTPIQQQSDFASYNVFLNKLNPSEFVVYGQATRHLPLIVRSGKLPEDILENATSSEMEAQEEIQEEQPSQRDLLDEEIKRDVDSIFTAPKAAPISQQIDEIVEDELTDEDLDSIDDMNILDIAPVEDIEEEPQEEIEEEVEVDYEPETTTYEEEPEFVSEEIAEEKLEEETLIEEEVFEEPLEYIQPEEEEEEEIEQYAEEEQPSESFSDVLTQQAEEPEFQQVIDEPKDVSDDILPVGMSTTPIVPIYSADVEPQVQSDEVVQGDIVMHPKYGKGTVEKMINYGSKTLCSINFDNVGRRLLDPTLAEIKKI